MNPVEKILKINQLANSLKKNKLVTDSEEAVALATQIVEGKKTMREVENWNNKLGGHPIIKEEVIKNKVDKIIEEVDKESRSSWRYDSQPQLTKEQVAELREKVQKIKTEISEEIKHPVKEEIKQIKEEVKELEDEIVKDLNKNAKIPEKVQVAPKKMGEIATNVPETIEKKTEQIEIQKEPSTLDEESKTEQFAETNEQIPLEPAQENETEIVEEEPEKTESEIVEEVPEEKISDDEHVLGNETDNNPEAPITNNLEEEPQMEELKNDIPELSISDDKSLEDELPPPSIPEEHKKGIFEKIKEKFTHKEFDITKTEGKLKDLVDEAEAEEKTIVDIKRNPEDKVEQDN